MAKNKPRTIIETPITFQSEGNQLVGIHHQAETIDGAPAPTKIIILCHGFTGNKIENKRLFVEAARAFASEGYDALRFDFYGSGDSAGDFADTLISHNIANLIDAMKWAREKGYARIALLGISMGGASAILTLADHPADALITWSCVPDMQRLIMFYAGKAADVSATVEVHEHEGWLIKRKFWEDAIRYNVQLSLGRIEAPKLIVQGTADESLFVQGFREFKNVVVPPADFMEIPGAGHTYQTPAHRRQVIRQTAIWLKRHF
jgi:pimeloyl-ACP methyl ester carboxylesterase